MERVPTQTDLQRLCDAAESISQFYRTHVAGRGCPADRWEYELDQFSNIVRLLPYPRHYFTVWSTDTVSWWERREEWQHWSDGVFEAFVYLASTVRNLHILWLDRKDSETSWVKSDEHSPIQRLMLDVDACVADLRANISFTPSEMQNLILESLDGTAMTKEELCHAVGAKSANTIYGSRSDKSVGGLNELMTMGLVVNGRSDKSGIRGYYRPDSPPM